MAIEPNELDKMAGVEMRAPLPPKCPECGYDLSGAVSSRCPECGRTFLGKELRQQAADGRALLARAKDVREFIQVGFKAGLLGIGLLLLGLALGGTNGLATILGRIGGLLCGITAVSMGFSYFRFLRIPEEVRHDVPNRPNPWFSLGTIVLGVLLVLACVVSW